MLHAAVAVRCPCQAGCRAAGVWRQVALRGRRSWTPAPALRCPCCWCCCWPLCWRPARTSAARLVADAAARPSGKTRRPRPSFLQTQAWQRTQAPSGWPSTHLPTAVVRSTAVPAIRQYGRGHAPSCAAPLAPHAPRTVAARRPSSRKGRWPDARQASITSCLEWKRWMNTGWKEGQAVMRSRTRPVHLQRERPSNVRRLGCEGR